jgi:hexosaminidase
LQAYFNKRLLKILEKYNKKMIGWDEILQPDLPTNAVIHSWRGPQALADAARKGYDGILSNGYYIDLGFPASQHYAVDPIPANTTLSPEEQKHILGGEATMWAEYVDQDTIDSRIWPRTAAIAERFWSPRETTDIDDMYRRLSLISIQLEELGLTHERNVDVLLRRMAGSKDIASLKLLASLVEPVKEYRRGQEKPSITLSPLTGLVDAARPDSEAARRFTKLVEGFLSDAPRFQMNAAELRATFLEWRNSELSLRLLIERSPALHEVKGLANDLTGLGTAGIEALTYISSNQAPTKEWIDAKQAILDEAAKPKGALEFPMLTSVRSLVMAAAELPQLKTMSANEWKKRVDLLVKPTAK